MKNSKKLAAAALLLAALAPMGLSAASAPGNVITVSGTTYSEPADGSGLVGEATWSYDFAQDLLQLTGYTGGSIQTLGNTRVKVLETSSINGGLEIAGDCLLQLAPEAELTITSDRGCLRGSETVVVTGPGSRLNLEQTQAEHAAVTASQVLFSGSGQVQLTSAGTGIAANGKVTMGQHGTVEMVCGQQAVDCAGLLMSDWNGSFQDEQAADGSYIRVEQNVAGKRENGIITVKIPDFGARKSTAVLACYDDRGRMLACATAEPEEGFWHFPILQAEGSYRVFASGKDQGPVCRSYEVIVG